VPAPALISVVLIGPFKVLFAERLETLSQPSCFVPYCRNLDIVVLGTLLDQILQRCAALALHVALMGASVAPRCGDHVTTLESSKTDTSKPYDPETKLPGGYL
jgi:hypothetical protein